VEKRERHKTELIKELHVQKKMDVIKSVHKRLLKKYSREVNVWIVKGELVRGLFFIDFTEGGHDKVYHFVPEKEVWLDDDLGARERRYVLLHERSLMSHGWTYSRAHREASKIEFHCRAQPKELEAHLRREIQRNQSFIPES
jgi:hypothetical protein